MARFLRTSYTDFNNMPSYMRRYLIDKIIDANTPKNN